ncbi:MAG: hypothetical protein H6719_15615 [Sandaracinaceae bacterium]|nr:hypothetical protein [Sandaracinaceae bacterium]
MPRWSLVLVGLASLTGCEESALFVVDLRTDYVAGQEVVQIHTSIDGGPATVTDVVFGDDLARGFRVAERAALAPGSHDVRVTLTGAGPAGTLASRLVRVDVARSRSVTVVITRDCEGVECGDPAAPSCLGGRCVAAECTPETPDACPDTGCHGDEECGSAVACAEGVCVTGACLFAPIAGACGADELCHPADGCRPPTAAPLTQVIQIAAGFEHTCALTSPTYTVYCWGNNLEGALGRGELESFAAVEVLRGDFFYLASGYGFSCVTEAGGSILCWGAGDSGALGRDSSGEPRGRCASVPDAFQVTGEPSAGSSHACVRTSAGLLCWGRNDFGQASPSTLDDPVRAVPLGVDGLALGLGERHSCAIESDTGTVLCWGDNASGELGDGTQVSRRAPAPVVGLPTASALAATSSLNGAAAGATCAIVEGGEVWCWGYNREGQLGNETSGFSAVPVRVMGLPRADALWAGAKSFCARDGAATYCWGQNTNGELGLGTRTSFETAATRAPMLDRFTSISLGHGFGCGMEGGHVFCWGDNRVGQINGRPGEPDDALTPLEVTLE